MRKIFIVSILLVIVGVFTFVTVPTAQASEITSGEIVPCYYTTQRVAMRTGPGPKYKVMYFLGQYMYLNKGAVLMEGPEGVKNGYRNVYIPNDGGLGPGWVPVKCLRKGTWDDGYVYDYVDTAAVYDDSPDPEPQPTTSRVLRDGAYFVKNAWRDECCLSIRNDEAPITVQDRNHCGWIRIKWDDAKNSYKITSWDGDMLIDVRGGECFAGASIISYWDKGGDNQRWIIERVTNDSFFLRCKANPNLLIDLPTNRPNLGESIHVWDFNGGDWQRWYFYFMCE